MKYILKKSIFGTLLIFITSCSTISYIPQSSLLQDATGTFVYVAKENQAIKVPVKIGNIVKDTYIIDSGLNVGDIVITNNLTKLKSGSSIDLTSKE
jgi:membrane fusion protein (multidrug efflux system)